MNGFSLIFVGSGLAKVVAKYDAGDGMLFQLVSTCLHVSEVNAYYCCPEMSIEIF